MLQQGNSGNAWGVRYLGTFTSGLAPGTFLGWSSLGVFRSDRRACLWAIAGNVSYWWFDSGNVFECFHSGNAYYEWSSLGVFCEWLLGMFMSDLMPEMFVSDRWECLWVIAGNAYEWSPGMWMRDHHCWKCLWAIAGSVYDWSMGMLMSDRWES